MKQRMQGKGEKTESKVRNGNDQQRKKWFLYEGVGVGCLGC
jgi:hypothetical protein